MLKQSITILIDYYLPSYLYPPGSFHFPSASALVAWVLVLAQVVPVWVPKSLGCTDDHHIGQLVGQLVGQLDQAAYPVEQHILTARESKDGK